MLATILLTGLAPASAGAAAVGPHRRPPANPSVQLQQEVDSYVRQLHGRQVSANVVDFAGGQLTVAAPGQRYAHDLAMPDTVRPAAFANCDSGDF